MDGTATPEDHDLNSVQHTRHRLGGISQNRFYELVNEGRIRVVKLGRRTFVTNSEIRRLVESLEAA